MLLDVSLADGLDRLTILEIKQGKITSPEKLVEIQKEIAALHEFAPFKEEYAFHYKLLLYTNLQVWESMDKVNSIDMDKRNTIEFAELAAKVYDYNDQRFRIKRLLNTMSNSALKEQKSYGSRHVVVTVRDVHTCIPIINYLSVRYDTVSFISDTIEDLKRMFTTPNFVYETIVSQYMVDADTFVLPDRSAYEFIPINYLASGLLGDFVHQLSVVNEKYLTSGRKGIIYMTDSIEPFRRGVVNTHSDISPFLNTQNYIYDVRIHDGSPCEINLSQWRQAFTFAESWHSIFDRYYQVIWARTPWFHTTGASQYSDTVFIATSPNRWWSQPFDHQKLISKLGPDVRFLAPAKSNYDDFVERTGISLPLVVVDTFAEMVSAIQGCKLFVSTLSAPLSVADALHKRRIALQLEDLDGGIASRTNASFLTYRSNLDNIQI